MIEPGRKLAWLALMEPYDAVKDIAVSVRFSTSTLSAESAGAWGGRGTIKGRIQEPFSIRATLLAANKIAAHALPSVGEIVLDNPTGELDHLLNYSWPGRRIELRLGYADDTSMASFDAAAPLGVKWIGTAKQPRATRNQIVIPLRGIEDLFDIPLQQNTFNPGYEPTVILDGLTQWVDGGDVADVGTGQYGVAVAFRRDTPTALQRIASKKASIGSSAAGWTLETSHSNDHQLVARIAQGSTQSLLTATLPAPSGPYNDGRRKIFAIRRVGSNHQLLAGSADGPTGAAPLSILHVTTAGSTWNFSNAASLLAGAISGSVARWDGEIERMAVWVGQAPSDATLDRVMNAAHPEELDMTEEEAQGLAVFWAMTENFGTDIFDSTSNGFDGVLVSGDSDASWSGLREGTSEMGGQPKPICYGRVNSARPVMVDPVKQVWMVHDRSIEQLIKATEGGLGIGRDTTTTGDIWTNAPASGQFRFQNGNGSIGLPSLIRTAIAGGPNNLQSELTFSAQGDAEGTGGYHERMQTNFRALIGQHAADREDLYQGPIHFRGLPLSEAPPEYTTGFYWREPITLAEAMDEVLNTADFHWTVDGRRPFDTAEVDDPLVITVFQIRDVSNETPDVVITLDSETEVSGVARDGYEISRHVPHLKELTVEFDKADGWMDLSQSLPGADIRIRRRLASQWRSLGPPLLVQPQAILDAYLEGESDTVQLGIRFTSHAHDEGLRRLATYDRPRPIAQLQRTADEWGLWIGAVVQVNGTRFGTGDGPRSLMLGLEDRTSRGQAGTRIYLYGQFTS